jgi:hypothetical protein
MEANLGIGIVAVAVVIGIVLLCAFSFVDAFTPELNTALVCVVAIVAIFAIVLMAFAFKNRE